MSVLDMFSLNGKTALVTGGSGRYGTQMVIALAEAGATVCVASRSLEKNQAFAASLAEKGLDVYADSYDQGSEESILALRDRMVARHGKVDILVNNSVYRPGDDGIDCPAEEFDKSIRINGTGLFLISRAFGHHMAETGEGSIINIGSYMGNLGGNDTLYQDVPGMMDGFPWPEYFFHKGGMHNLTRVLASYYGPKGVRVNCLALGGLFNNQDPRFIERYNACTFLKRMANDTDVKGIIVYLASAASAYVTGTVIPVDGGYSAK